MTDNDWMKKWEQLLKDPAVSKERKAEIRRVLDLAEDVDRLQSDLIVGDIDDELRRRCR